MSGMEKFNLEFKRDVTRSFLKTVSAFANYVDGLIVFGIDDDAHIVGVESAASECLRVENMINDSIEPLPSFRLEVVEKKGKTLIELTVIKGKDTPYYYQSKAYKRSGTSTVEVDRFELRRLAAAGIGMDYEARQSPAQGLHFSKLESELRSKAGVTSLNLDVLKTLNLYNRDGYYNVAAELLADSNELEFSGVDIVKFGRHPNTIQYRETINRRSLLIQYDRAIELFRQYYQYEEVKGYERVQKELIPKEAFRESLANAIIH